MMNDFVFCDHTFLGLGPHNYGPWAKTAQKNSASGAEVIYESCYCERCGHRKSRRRKVIPDEPDRIVN